VGAEAKGLRTELTLDIKLHAKQGNILASPATEILYGGAAGGGKSYLLRALAILWCYSFPGLQVYLFRRISDDLVKNHVEGPKGFRAMLAEWVQAGLVEIIEGEIRFKFNGSKIFLCHCHDEKDRFKYQGAEIHVLLIDELTHFSKTIYAFLRSRVRMVGMKLPAELQGRFPRIIAGSNPGNVGHQWVKAAWVDHGAGQWIAPEDDGGMLREYVPAKLGDNPSMTKDDPSYRMRLRGLGSPQLVKAMEDGDWNVVEGAYFSEWTTERHVLEPFEIPEHWLRFRSFDWGSARPFSVGWWAIASEDHLTNGRILPKGCMVRYREWYGAREPNVGLKLTAPKVAQGILDRTPKEERERISYSVADPACFIENGGPSIAETMATAGVVFRPGDNKRVQGWTQMRDRLVGDEAPMLYVFETCRDFIRTVPALMHDEHKPEDLDSDGEDHAGDDCRYACMSRPWTKPKPNVIDPKYIDIGIPTMAQLVQQHTEKWQRQRHR
jgi:hypothetical protein